MQIQNAQDRPNPRLGSTQMALLLILGAETIFFGTLLSSYLFMLSSAAGSKYRSPISGTGLLLPVINTVVLFISALIANLAQRAIEKDQQRRLQMGLQAALVLGLLFVAGQAVEFLRSGMHPSDPSIAGMYFALITFHALHVLAGVFVLALNLLRAHLGDFSPRSYTAVQAGNWFWYYVTAVWAVLFTVLYLV